MKKPIILGIVLVIIIAVLVGIFVFISKVQAPSALQGNDGIEITMPKINDSVSSPLKITGIVKGNGWAGFEGQVGMVHLQDGTGKDLAIGILTATTDWMSFPVSFETTLYFNYPADGVGKLVFYNENMSGEASKSKTFTLPVKLTKSLADTTTVKVYFNNKVGQSSSCAEVFYTQRIVPKTEAVATVALEELFKGPSDVEKLAGFSSGINPGVKVQSIAITNGVATVDFNDALQKDVAGSCRTTAIKAQITQTLKQFPTVKSVIISINGKTQGILQP